MASPQNTTIQVFTTTVWVMEIAFFLELAVIQACRDGPHKCHYFYKGLLPVMDVHKASVAGSRILRLLCAGFTP